MSAPPPTDPEFQQTWTNFINGNGIPPYCNTDLLMRLIARAGLNVDAVLRTALSEALHEVRQREGLPPLAEGAGMGPGDVQTHPTLLILHPQPRIVPSTPIDPPPPAQRGRGGARADASSRAGRGRGAGGSPVASPAATPISSEPPPMSRPTPTATIPQTAPGSNIFSQNTSIIGLAQSVMNGSVRRPAGNEAASMFLEAAAIVESIPPAASTQPVPAAPAPTIPASPVVQPTPPLVAPIAPQPALRRSRRLQGLHPSTPPPTPPPPTRPSRRRRQPPLPAADGAQPSAPTLNVPSQVKIQDLLNEQVALRAQLAEYASGAARIARRADRAGYTSVAIAAAVAASEAEEAGRAEEVAPGVLERVIAAFQAAGEAHSAAVAAATAVEEAASVANEPTGWSNGTKRTRDATNDGEERAPKRQRNTGSLSTPQQATLASSSTQNPDDVRSQASILQHLMNDIRRIAAETKDVGLGNARFAIVAIEDAVAAARFADEADLPLLLDNTVNMAWITRAVFDNVAGTGDPTPAIFPPAPDTTRPRDSNNDDHEERPKELKEQENVATPHSQRTCRCCKGKDREAPFGNALSPCTRTPGLRVGVQLPHDSTTERPAGSLSPSSEITASDIWRYFNSIVEAGKEASGRRAMESRERARELDAEVAMEKMAKEAREKPETEAEEKAEAETREREEKEAKQKKAKAKNASGKRKGSGKGTGKRSRDNEDDGDERGPKRRKVAPGN